MTRPHFPRLLDQVLNPLFTLFNHPPYLPFQLTKLIRQSGFSLFAAVNQLAPWYSGGAAGNTPQEEAKQNQLLVQMRRLLSMTQQDSQKLLALEHVPIAGDARMEGVMRERLVEWLVQNEVRNDPLVSAAMQRAIERRNAEIEGHGDG
jgi:hypothetical protein